MCVQSSVSGHSGSFYLLAAQVQSSIIRVPAFSSFESIPSSVIAGSSSNSVFNFLRDHQPVVHSSCHHICFCCLLIRVRHGWLPCLITIEISLEMGDSECTEMKLKFCSTAWVYNPQRHSPLLCLHSRLVCGPNMKFHGGLFLFFALFVFFCIYT